MQFFMKKTQKIVFFFVFASKLPPPPVKGWESRFAVLVARGGLGLVGLVLREYCSITSSCRTLPLPPHTPPPHPDQQDQHDRQDQGDQDGQDDAKATNTKDASKATSWSFLASAFAWLSGRGILVGLGGRDGSCWSAACGVV